LVGHLDWLHNPSGVLSVQVEHFDGWQQVSTLFLSRKSSETVQESATEDAQSHGAFVFIERGQFFPSVFFDAVDLASSGDLSVDVTAGNINFSTSDVVNTSKGGTSDIHWSFFTLFNLSVRSNPDGNHVLNSNLWLLVLCTADDESGFIESLYNLW
jgi:hypothetical protein